eukprot:m.21949 g.21949  ORF g.21949 m.21949 type:complete len:359 (+) comp7298_c0_seq2:225-1301(+)
MEVFDIEELFDLIMSFATGATLCRAALVCRTWRKRILRKHANPLWPTCLVRLTDGDIEMEHDLDFNEAFRIFRGAFQRCVDQCSRPPAVCQVLVNAPLFFYDDDTFLRGFQQLCTQLLPRNCACSLIAVDNCVATAGYENEKYKIQNMEPTDASDFVAIQMIPKMRDMNVELCDQERMEAILNQVSSDPSSYVAASVYHDLTNYTHIRFQDNHKVLLKDCPLAGGICRSINLFKNGTSCDCDGAVFLATWGTRVRATASTYRDIRADVELAKKKMKGVSVRGSFLCACVGRDFSLVLDEFAAYSEAFSSASVFGFFGQGEIGSASSIDETIKEHKEQDAHQNQFFSYSLTTVCVGILE